MDKIIIMVILMIITLQIDARPKRFSGGNSNGFTMNAWYGGNNKHKCGLHKTKVRLKTRLLKY